MPVVWIPPVNQPVSTRIYFSGGKVPGVRHLRMCGAVSPLSVCHHGIVFHEAQIQAYITTGIFVIAVTLYYHWHFELIE